MFKKYQSSPSSTSNFSDDDKLRIKKQYIKNKMRFHKANIEKEIINNESSENKKYTKILNSAKRHPLKYHEYTKLKYKDHVYNQNDTIMILNCDDPENDFIAILRKIMKAIYQGSLHIILEVQWYYKKSDLPSKFASVLKYISENEIFLTEHKDLTTVECINGPCSIVSFEEYEVLPGIPVNTYFSRSNYDTIKKRITPPVEEWPKNCVCKCPINPDLLYIQCDKCEEWFHAECVGLSEEEVSKIEQYKCLKCKNE